MTYSNDDRSSDGNFSGGTGTSINPYIIETADDLHNIRNYPNDYYEIIKDIDLDVAPYNEGKGWNPFAFNGHLNGNGCEIRNLYIRDRTGNIGLFSELDSNSSVKNLGIVNIDIDVNTNQVGGLVGQTNRVPSVYIDNCYTKGKIKGNDRVGGIQGYHYNYSSYSNDPQITNCYSTCHIVGEDNVGGIVGQSSGRFSSRNLHINNCYFAGFIENNSNSGGIIDSTGRSGRINNCFFDKDISDQYDCNGNSTALTTEEMHNPENFKEADWDEDIWIFEEYKYPRLWFEDINIDVELLPVTDIRYTSMTLNGRVLRLNEHPKVEVFFRYTDDPNGLDNGNYIETKRETIYNPGETFSYEVTGINPGTTYFVEAHCISKDNHIKRR